jgi:hypothetical protein
LTRSIVAHSVTLTLIAVVVGVPLGLALGRTVYLAVARGVGAIPEPELAIGRVVSIIVGATVIAIALATLPAHMARRPCPDALRSD